MSTPSHQLLNALGARIRPDGFGAAPPQRPPVESLDFQSLLQKASGGELISGRSVAPARGSGIELQEEAVRALSRAADEAESRGAAHLFALLGDTGYEIDVPTRTIRREAKTPDLENVQTGIDAFAVLQAEASPDEESEDGVAHHVLTRRPPTNSLPSPSLLDAMHRKERSETGPETTANAGN